MGMYNIDLGLKNIDTEEIVGLLEVDFYSIMNPHWPDNYWYIHGLLRKEKYRKWPHPSLFATINLHGDKAVIITKEKMASYKYDTRKKLGFYQWVAEIPMTEGMIVGRNITNKERRKFPNAYYRD